MVQSHVCDEPSLNEYGTQPLVGQLTFYHLNLIISGTATAIVCLSTLTLIFLHATHFSNPGQQAKIIKIIYIIPLFSIFSFISIVAPKAAASLTAWTEFFQAIALGTFFLLLSEMVSPHDNQRDMFFAALEEVPVSGRNKMKKAAPGQGLIWFRQRWIAVFQYPPVALVVAVVTAATDSAGVYCETSSKPYFAHIWITIISNVSVSIAVLSVVAFYQVLRKHLAHHRPFSKLIAFKAIIFLVFIQGIVFTILRTTNQLNGTATLTYADLNVGIPTLLICLEMVPFSIFFHYAYTYHPYLLSSANSFPGSKNQNPRYTPTSYQGGFLGIRAILVAISPLETLQAIGFAITLFSSQDRRHQPVQGPNVGMEPLRRNASDSSDENQRRQWPGSEQQQQQQSPPSYGYEQPGPGHQQVHTAYQPLSNSTPELDTRTRFYQPPGQGPEVPVGPLNPQRF